MSGTLRIPATTIDQLTTALLQDDGLERAAVLDLADSGDDLVVADCEIVPDAAMTTIGATECQPDDDYDVDFVDRCTGNDRHPLIVHSHPFADEAWFSSRDDSKMRGEAGWIHALKDCRVLFGVLSQDELRIDEVDSDGTRTPVEPEIIGDWTLEDDATVTPVPSSAAPPVDVDTERYDRAIRAIGEHGQQQLAETHVAVVGCGGIGADLVKELAGQGVQQVTFVDPDRVEQSNLPRLPQASESDVGRYKVAVMQQWYGQQVPGAETTIISLPVEETAEYLLDLGVDVILAGLDRITPRVWLNEFAARHLIPYIDAGSIVDVDEDGRITTMQTEVQVIAPGTSTGCFECIGRDNTEALRRENLPQPVLEEEVARGYIPDTALTPEPAVNPLNSVAAAEAVDALSRIVTGYRPPEPTVGYDAVEKRMDAGPTHERENCETCSRFVGTGESGPIDTIDDLDLEATVDALADTRPGHSRDDGSTYSIPDAVTAFFTEHLR
ncbi:ThiF family adenylyltransferase [Haloterrigena sp. SYSU A558-1]|uniref:ThiF family adenylyltransferase n=1 Tax=Haloterrigena gelatinilytica TaxID=2741724 RepID=A0ABX2LEV5_9EURY|nr:ThiF family adenylyltransferase [Haloterrigena gelatinilytica]NUC74784.1 ThiF family adenylyltransferase [Haloterrigena gelatinilytica]